MFIWSLKMNRRAWTVLGAAALCLLGAVFFFSGIGKARPAAGEGRIHVETPSGKTAEERLAFLAGFGWEVEQEPLEIMEIVIPEEFDPSMERYNSIQKSQSMDLSDAKGRRCRRYTYRVINYPGRPEDVQASLLVMDGRIIGEDMTLIGPESSVCALTGPVG
ncbi:MAG: DUF4830 domain-containing protein [Oscillospiraceae bacterium]|nr:DUF4830 domain-containing protein [Oscillospiraceae bacterium]